VFTVAAGLTLAVCIGANVALFTIVDHVLFRPLGVPDSDRIVLIYNSYPKAGATRASATVPDYFERRSEIGTLGEQALFAIRDPSLDTGGRVEPIRAMQVTPSFFRVVQVSPSVGRAFNEDEGEIGRNRVVVLSEPLRRRLFGSADTIGENVRIDGELHEVVGVLPADFAFIDAKVQVWLPLAFTDQQKTQRFSNNWGFLGRLKAGATLDQAQAQVDALNATNLDRFPESRQLVESTGFHSVVVRLQDDLVRDVRAMLYLLWAGAFFVLLIGCVNVASLTLARSRVRLQEIATRVSLGASRWHLLRQLVTEHLILASVSATAGLLIAYVALQLFATSVSGLPRGSEVAIDVYAAGYVALLACVIGVLLGTIPTLGIQPISQVAILREEGRSTSSGRGMRTVRRTLVVTQIAVAFLLLIGAGLLLASFRHVVDVDPGFATDRVLTLSVSLPQTRYPDLAALRRFAAEAVEAVGSTPGIVTVGTTTAVPLSDRYSQDVIFPEGYRLGPGQSLIGPFYSAVTPGYFEAMGIRLIRGRFFDDRDSIDAPRVAIVDEQLAGRFWPGVDPVGKRVFEPSNGDDLTAITDRTQWITVVGVIREVKLRGLVEGVGSVGSYYMPQAQRPGRVLSFSIRTSAAPESVVPLVRERLAQIDRELPLFDLQTMDERLESALETRRSPLVLASLFSGIALLLSGIGVYGVLAYLVTQRRREIAIRLALGSSTAEAFRLILREGILLTTAGLVLGAVLVRFMVRGLESQLFGVRPGDPLVLTLAGATLALVALAACIVPARRAARVDPIVALRCE
jgi:predicted permease